MAKRKRGSKKRIESYDHSDKKRVNNPPAGLVTPDTDRPVRGPSGTSHGEWLLT